MRTKRPAFTLIELLVVIAIIALLLSIIVPALRVAKERTMDTICSSNIRQYQIAMAMYCNDNDSKFANGEDWIYIGFINGSGVFPPAGVPFGCVWHDASLYPNGTVVAYLGDNNVALCPVFKMISPSRCNCATNPGSGHNAAIQIEPQFNYTLSAYLGAYRTRPTINANQAIKITKVRSPSQVVVFGEENPMSVPANTRPNLSRGTSGTLNDCLLWPLDPAMAKTIIAGQTNGKYADFNTISFNDSFATYHRAKDGGRYLGVSNAVFVDGHVEYVTAEETLKYTWPF